MKACCSGCGLERCPQSLDGRYAFARDGRQRLSAGFRGQTIDQHHARPALLEAATETRAGEAEMIAQHIQQRGVAIRRDLDRTRVDGEEIEAMGPRVADPSTKNGPREGW